MTNSAADKEGLIKLIEYSLLKLNNGFMLTQSDCRSLIRGIDTASEQEDADTGIQDVHGDDLPSIETLVSANHKMKDQALSLIGEFKKNIAEGCLPSKKSVATLLLLFSSLRNGYEEVFKQYLKTADDPSTSKDMSIDEYAQAIRNSNKYKEQKELETTIQLLKRFINIKSEKEVYTNSLMPYHNHAMRLLQMIENTDRGKLDYDYIKKESQGIILFMKAFELEDIDDSDDGIELFDQLGDYFNGKVMLGLANHKYQEYAVLTD